MAPATAREVEPEATNQGAAAPLAPRPLYSREDMVAVLSYTRNWIQYGVVGFAVACILIGAVERLFGR